MAKRSRLEHVAGNPGDNVIIPIPLVDRGKGDPCNIMGGGGGDCRLKSK